MTDNAALTAYPGGTDSTRGVPYYEKLKRDIRETLQKKRLLDKNMVEFWKYSPLAGPRKLILNRLLLKIRYIGSKRHISKKVEQETLSRALTIT